MLMQHSLLPEACLAAHGLSRPPSSSCMLRHSLIHFSPHTHSPPAPSAGPPLLVRRSHPAYSTVCFSVHLHHQSRLLVRTLTNWCVRTPDSTLVPCLGSSLKVPCPRSSVQVLWPSHLLISSPSSSPLSCSHLVISSSSIHPLLLVTQLEPLLPRSCLLTTLPRSRLLTAYFGRAQLEILSLAPLPLVGWTVGQMISQDD